MVTVMPAMIDIWVCIQTCNIFHMKGSTNPILYPRWAANPCSVVSDKFMTALPSESDLQRR
jgi:hypothetical protein